MAKYIHNPIEIEAQEYFSGINGRDKMFCFLIKHDPKQRYWGYATLLNMCTRKQESLIYLTDGNGKVSALQPNSYVVKELSPNKGFFGIESNQFKKQYTK